MERRKNYFYGFFCVSYLSGRGVRHEVFFLSKKHDGIDSPVGAIWNFLLMFFGILEKLNPYCCTMTNNIL